MVGVAMRIHHVTNWLFGAIADRSEQLPSLAHATAGINHRHRIITYDEADVGDGSLIVSRHEFHHADMNKDARRNFINLQRLYRLSRTRRRLHANCRKRSK